MKKIGIILTASALSIGMFSSAVSAASTVSVGGQPVNVVAQVNSTEKVVTKEDLLKKFRSAFPGFFDFVNASDFHMSSYDYPEREETNYQMFFNKLQNGKDTYGNISFYGEDLEVESFSYEPIRTPDSLFPAKVSKEEAKKVATDFIKKFLKAGNYKLNEENNDYFYYSKQILTSPISYSFSFNRMKDDVAIADQLVTVTVLGNGEIVNFYNSAITKSPTFDDVKKVKDQKDALEKMKENLTARLQYQVNTNYETGKNDVKLVYVPDVLSVSAVTGEWFNGKDFLAEQPTKMEYEKVTNSALPVRQNGMTKEEAKKAAEKLLQVKSDKVKLSIQSVEEVKNSYGQEVISIQYMYNYANGGSGSSLEFDKKTGELLQYHNAQNSMMIELNGTKEEVAPISKEEAIAQAVKYLKELVPSYLHEYAMPLEDSYVDDARGNYYLNFPRIVNGVMVSGDQISVSIYKDGSLENLSVSRPQIEEWPTLDKVISLKEVEDTLSKALSLKMSYMKGNHKKENSHYDLIYSPLFNETAFNVLDANSGKWINQYNIEVTPEVSHPTAAEELNYLIKAKVLTVNDPKTFNGDAAVSKGEAIKIMMNSLTYIYETNIRESESMKQSFTNINSKHASYQAVERAVEAGILKTDQKTFDVNNPVTKEELAVWYIRALGLEQAAIQKNIFKNEFTDGKKVTEANIGYVILANSLGLVKAEKNHFNPKKEITYADLAVSSIRLAHEISNKGRDFRYSY